MSHKEEQQRDGIGKLQSLLQGLSGTKMCLLLLPSICTLWRQEASTDWLSSGSRHIIIVMSEVVVAAVGSQRGVRGPLRECWGFGQPWRGPIALLKLQPTQGTTAVVCWAESLSLDCEAHVNNGNVFLIVFSKTSEGAKWLITDCKDATQLGWKPLMPLAVAALADLFDLFSQCVGLQGLFIS